MIANPARRGNRIRLTELSGPLKLITKLPPPVRPGDRVGVAALSGFIDEKKLDLGLAALESFGLKPVPAANLRSKKGLFAGSDAERVEGFHRLVADPTLSAIFFARGGHGVLRVLPLIDWDLVASVPRAYIGYSDLTPFLMEVVRRCGRVAFQGPMVADFSRGLLREEEESLWACLEGSFPIFHPLAGWERPQTVQGPLLGGCLSLLTAVLGTPFGVDLSGSILFWEEVSEPLYRVDRMLTHLRLSGNLPRISGMVVGHIEWDSGERSPDVAWARLAEETLSEYSWPLAIGLNSGHRAPNLTLPIGLGAVMDPQAGGLSLGEG